MTYFSCNMQTTCKSNGVNGFQQRLNFEVGIDPLSESHCVGIANFILRVVGFHVCHNERGNACVACVMWSVGHFKLIEKE